MKLRIPVFTSISNQTDQILSKVLDLYLELFLCSFIPIFCSKCEKRFNIIPKVLYPIAKESNENTSN